VRREPPWPPYLAEFPQVMRPNARWWKPPLGLVLGFVLLVVIGIPILTVAAVVVYAQNGEFDQNQLEPSHALGLLANNLLLAALIPVALLVVLAVHRLRPRFLCSVEGWLRWRLLAGLLLAALVVTGVFIGAQLLLAPPDTKDAGSTAHVAGLLAVVLLTTPLQAAGEEFFFRGYLVQAVGSWFSRPRASAVVGGLVSSTLFALAHGTQGPALFADRFAFGAVAAWLVWRTGGLEAGIALHVLNNLVSLVLAVVTGGVADALAPGDISIGSALVDVAMMVVYALVVSRWLAGRGSRRVGEVHGRPEPDGALAAQ
jgi:membrane protease YdiL (CAAX protease family)